MILLPSSERTPTRDPSDPLCLPVPLELAVGTEKILSSSRFAEKVRREEQVELELSGLIFERERWGRERKVEREVGCRSQKEDERGEKKRDGDRFGGGREAASKLRR